MSGSSAAAATSAPTVPAPRHSIAEDVLGILTGTFVVSFGLFLMTTADAVTGGTAGLALLLSYAIPVPFGVIFFAINIPFFGLAVWKKGWNFTIRTIISVALVSAFTSLNPVAIPDLQIDPVYAVIAGNLLAGMGLLALFRHRSSLGGFNILALILQERFGIRAGYAQMVLDVAIVLASFAVVSPLNVLLSAMGAVVVNIVLAFNHRPGRYFGT